MTTDATRERFIAGDPLRGLAALLVAIYHVAFFTLPRTTPGVPLEDLFTEGYGTVPGLFLQSLEMALYVFFVLSGYLISRPFVRWIVAGSARPRIGAYTRNRLLRIVPAFWLAIVLSLLIHGTMQAHWVQVTGFFLFLQTYMNSPPVTQWVAQGWTLTIEIAFYALVPIGAFAAALVLRGRGTVRSRAVGVLLIAGGVLVASLLLRRADGNTLRDQREVEAMLFAFAPGIALAALEHLLPQRLRSLRRPGRLAAGLAITGVAVLALRTQADAGKLASSGFFAAAGTGLLVAAPLIHQWATGSCWRGLDNAALRWLGACSYSLYVLHVLIEDPLLGLADGRGAWAGFLLVAMVALPLCIAAAGLSYRFVERPFLNLRAGRSRPAPEPAPA